MIFPVLSGLISPLRVPVTYFLLTMNLLVFLATLERYDVVDNEIDVVISDRAFMEVQGLAFAVMIEREPKAFSRLLVTLSGRALAGDKDSRRILGGLANRNVIFTKQAASFDFGGDEIALESWRKKFASLRALENEHPSYLWGLRGENGGFMQYISYQFAHSGLLHLFWNMVFLVIFGTFVELNLGASFVILTYVGSGVAGALLYTKLSGLSSAPLVGASAAVSGLMALVGVVWLKKEKLKFFYWLLPVDGYFGFVALPSWLVIFVSLLPDVSGYLGGASEFGSVAYSAHIGGAVFGAILAGFLLLGWLEIEIDPNPDGMAPSGS